MVQIQVSNAVVERLTEQGVEDIGAFIGALLDQLDDAQIAIASMEAARRALAGETPEARMAALRAGFAEMREGLSSQELRELADAMNAEYIEPEDAN